MVDGQQVEALQRGEGQVERADDEIGLEEERAGVDEEGGAAYLYSTALAFLQLRRQQLLGASGLLCLFPCPAC